MKEIPLCRLEPGQSGVIAGCTLSGGMARRVAELGMIPGTTVTCVMRAPTGSPAAYEVRGSVIALRTVDAAAVSVKVGLP